MIECGFIGLGSQGAPIARRMISAGFPTTLWARRAESLLPFRDTSAKVVDSVAALGPAAMHVGVCVVNDDDVRQVCADLVAAMRPGSQIAIHSTVHPDTVRSAGLEAAERKIAVIDAPVSGGAPAAEAGTLTLMLGGNPDAIAAARPIFESFALLIVRLGDLGAGQHAKLVNNALLAANIGVANAALAAGEQLGLDGPMLLQLLQASSGRSLGLDVRGRMTSPTSFAHGAALLAKDVLLLKDVLGQQAPAVMVLDQASERFLSIATATRN